MAMLAVAMAVALALSPQRVPLFGDVGMVGQLNVQACVGGQDVQVQVDTGSSDLGLLSSLCSKCRGHLYDPQHGKAVPFGQQGVHCDLNFHGQCAVAQSFADSTGWHAALFNDSFSFGACSARGPAVEALVERFDIESFSDFSAK